jgi:hypothetical protein
MTTRLRQPPSNRRIGAFGSCRARRRIERSTALGMNRPSSSGMSASPIQSSRFASPQVTLRSDGVLNQPRVNAPCGVFLRCVARSPFGSALYLPSPACGGTEVDARRRCYVVESLYAAPGAFTTANSPWVSAKWTRPLSRFHLALGCLLDIDRGIRAMSFSVILAPAGTACEPRDRLWYRNGCNFEHAIFEAPNCDLRP